MKKQNNTLCSFFLNPKKALYFTLSISLLLHMIIIIDLYSADNIPDRQIPLTAARASITYINVTPEFFQWDSVEPERRIKKDSGEIPILHKKKKKVEERKKERIQEASLSETEITARENYQTQILKRIHRNKYYPTFAKRMGMEGAVTVRFILNRDGTLACNPSVNQSCDHEVLNKAAVTTIITAGPFKPFPDEIALGKDRMTFNVTIDYNLKLL